MASSQRSSYPVKDPRWEMLARRGLVAVLVMVALGCGQSPDDAEHSQYLVSISGAAIVGFEVPAGWTVSSGTVSSSTTAFTQGAAALAVTAPQNYTTLVSGKLSSDLAQLAGLTNVGAAVEVDLDLPTSQPNPSYFGALQLYVSVPSRGVYNQYLGQFELTGRQLGSFQTYAFAVTDFARTKLGGAKFTDLTFTIALNAPSGAKGKYIFDNLRTTSPATAPVGSRPSVNLTALLTQSPKVSTPGKATFTPGTIQIPASFRVNVGSPGTGTALFEVGFGTTTNVSCTYVASPDKTSYLLSSCSTGNAAGDIVAGGFAKLTIQSASPTAPLTKIKAQLAYNAVGDQVGSKLVPPIPTFWGETVAEINAISQAFTQLQINTPPPVRRAVNLPIPSFALRQGNGTPLNALTGAPPRVPSDPPFDFKGDLNNSSDGSPTGVFDGYYELSGGISASPNPDPVTQGITSRFDATGTVGIVALGEPVNVLSVTAVVTTDNGGTTASGSTNPTGKVTVQTTVLGQDLPPESATALTGFTFHPSLQTSIDTPPIPIWIFSIEGGVNATAGIDVTGALSLNGFGLTATPNASVGVHVSGSINILVASGGVDVSVQLIDVQIPTTASLTLDVSTSPGNCGASFHGTVDGSVKVSSGGGSVDLFATIGPCPFCWDDSFNIFTWQGLDLGTVHFPAPFPLQFQFPVSFPTSLCIVPLEVGISSPVQNATVFPGVGVATSASANRSKTSSTGIDLVDCQFLTWTSSDSTAIFSPSNIGCSPVVTFGPGTAGTTQTLTVSATDQFNETGSATVTVNVAAPPAGPVPAILSPVHGIPPLAVAATLPVKGTVTGGTGQVTATFTSLNPVAPVGSTVASMLLGAPITVTAGSNVPLDVGKFAFPLGTQQVKLTVTDEMGVSNIATVEFKVVPVN